MKTTNIVNTELHKKYEENQDARALTLDAEGFDNIISVLTHLYSNVEYAVLREYVSNALDSHTKAGITEPVEIFVPSELCFNYP